MMLFSISAKLETLFNPKDLVMAFLDGRVQGLA